jgi:hypothetical protein
MRTWIPAILLVAISTSTAVAGRRTTVQAAVSACRSVAAFESDQDACVRVVTTASFDARRAVAACANLAAFTSDRQTCIESAVTASRDPSAAIDACGELAAFTSDRLACVASAVRLRGDADEVIRGCTELRTFTSDRLECVASYMPAFQRGDRVEAHREGVWYVGTITRLNSRDATYRVKYDDGTVSKRAPEDHVRAFVPYAVGERVQGRWTNGHWYWGTIAEAYDDGTWRIDYDDGDVSTALTAAAIVRAD